MIACESVRGEWGKPCPDCGQTLPRRPGPLASWMSQRSLAFPSGSSAGLGVREVESWKHRVTARQLEVVAAVERAGNQSAAARLLGVTPATVSRIVATYRKTVAALA